MAEIKLGDRVKVVKVVPFNDAGDLSGRALARLGQEGEVIDIDGSDAPDGYGYGVRFETLDAQGSRDLYFYDDELEEQTK